MSKCITLSDDAYNNLKSLKKGDESFSDIVKRLTGIKKSKSLLDLAGIWEDNPETVKIMKNIYKDRKNFKLRKFN
ncbi:MAG: antitoxin VapB family protein [Nanoarchaeota archaeon]